MKNVQDQLDQLHRTIRRQHYSLLALGMTLGVLLLSSAITQDEKDLELQRLTIVDTEGTALISLGVGEEGRAQIVFPVGEERESLFLGTTELGHAAINLFNHEGGRIVTLGGTKDGHGGVRVDSTGVTPAFYMGRDLRGNGQVPEDVHAGRRLD